VDGLPFSQACENNRPFILAVLRRVFSACDGVLEIGAGTGQHAVAFSAAMPWLRWLPSELSPHLSVLRPRCEAASHANLLDPVPLDVTERPWALDPLPQGLFSANTLHIMPWEHVEALFMELGDRAAVGSVLAVYGPFNYGGRYTSDSNARFDEWLAARDPRSAIRDFEAVDALAASAGFSLREDNALPANNRLLVWSRMAPEAARAVRAARTGPTPT
jgi:hypothetical protein